MIGEHSKDISSRVKITFCEDFNKDLSHKKEAQVLPGSPNRTYPEPHSVLAEQYIAMLPLSREVNRLKYIKKTLVVYRSVIGQPMQEELLQFLEEHLSPEEIEDLVSEAMIDLSPPTSK